MAIQTAIIEQAQKTIVYTSTGNTAVTWASITNYSGASATIDVYVVPAAASATDQNLIIKGLLITAGDSHQLYHGAEKLVLADGDTIQAQSDSDFSLNAVIGYASI